MVTLFPVRAYVDPQCVEHERRAALGQVRLVCRGPATWFLLLASLGTPEPFLELLAVPFEIHH